MSDMKNAQATITVVSPLDPSKLKKKNVAVYTRVSSEFGTRSSSIDSQEYGLETMVKEHNGWQYFKTYTDEGFSGTKENRPAFQEMLQDARDGKIDIIITKSISRFARNIKTTLSTIREMRELNVEIIFDEENLNSSDHSCDMLIALMSTFAEAYAKSASDNQKVKIRHQFEQGIPTYSRIYGYRMVKGKYYVVEEEAEVVRRIYEYYLSGMGIPSICKKLIDEKYKPLKDGTWNESTVFKILRNEAYLGKLLLQKTYAPEGQPRHYIKNDGVLRQYLVEDAHEPIIDKETFEAVRQEIERRAEKWGYDRSNGEYRYTGLITCGNCGMGIRHACKHIKQYTRETWVCPTYNNLGKANCPVGAIPENSLDNATRKAIAVHDGNIIKEYEIDVSREALLEKIKSITAYEDHTLIYEFKDGETVNMTWELVSRKNSWTPEMKELARQKAYAKKGGIK